MNPSKTGRVLFNDALELARAFVKGWRPLLSNEITLVRDLRGRIRAILHGSHDDLEGDPNLALFKERFSEQLGPYGFPQESTVLFEEDLSQLEVLDWRGDRRLLGEEDDLKIYLLDRQVTGQDWMRGPMGRQTRVPRVTFFAIKGGVGRSTALCVWSWRLAQRGRKVLVFDLDLESPGTSSTLLPNDRLPDFGIVDWFVEDGVGQSALIEDSLAAQSPLSRNARGEVLVVPAYGRKTGDYLPKLARCYMEGGGGRSESWPERVRRLVEDLETAYSPDLVILDSRAGIHDIGAVLVTRMDADALLFAVDSLQTWTAYSLLFSHWKQHPHVTEFRDRLRMVAGMVPETGRERYLRSFREHAWDLFREHLYDEAGPDESEAFSYDLEDEDGPHSPYPVFWHRALLEFDPAASPEGMDARTAQESLGVFMDGLDQWIDLPSR